MSQVTYYMGIPPQEVAPYFNAISPYFLRICIPRVGIIKVIARVWNIQIRASRTNCIVQMINRVVTYIDLKILEVWSFIFQIIISPRMLVFEVIDDDNCMLEISLFQVNHNSHLVTICSDGSRVCDVAGVVAGSRWLYSILVIGVKLLRDTSIPVALRASTLQVLHEIHGWVILVWFNSRIDDLSTILEKIRCLINANICDTLKH